MGLGNEGSVSIAPLKRVWVETQTFSIHTGAAVGALKVRVKSSGMGSPRALARVGNNSASVGCGARLTTGTDSSPSDAFAGLVVRTGIGRRKGISEHLHAKDSTSPATVRHALSKARRSALYWVSSMLVRRRGRKRSNDGIPRNRGGHVGDEKEIRLHGVDFLYVDQKPRRLSTASESVASLSPQTPPRLTRGTRDALL